MATTTPNYGWDVPTSTDYVKDGATAIETLGDDIDASLFSITGGKNVGLQFLASSSFSSATDFTMSSVFSADYNFYRLIVDITSTSVNGQNGIQLVATSTPATSNYNSAGVGFGSGGSGSNNANEGTGEMRWGARGSNGGTFIMDIMNPFLASQTKFVGSNFAYSGATPIVTASAFAGTHTTTTSYNGIKIINLTAAGGTGSTATGIAKIYGYRN